MSDAFQAIRYDGGDVRDFTISVDNETLREFGFYFCR